MSREGAKLSELFFNFKNPPQLKGDDWTKGLRISGLSRFLSLFYELFFAYHLKLLFNSITIGALIKKINSDFDADVQTWE